MSVSEAARKARSQLRSFEHLYDSHRKQRLIGASLLLHRLDHDRLGARRSLEEFRHRLDARLRMVEERAISEVREFYQGVMDEHTTLLENIRKEWIRAHRVVDERAIEQARTFFAHHRFRIERLYEL